MKPTKLRPTKFFPRGGTLIAEGVRLALNFTVFRYLARRLDGLPPELVSFLGTFLVFFCFAYPVRRLWVFRLPDKRGSASAP